MVLTQEEEDGIRLILAREKARVQLEVAANDGVDSLVRPFRIAHQAAETNLRDGLK